MPSPDPSPDPAATQPSWALLSEFLRLLLLAVVVPVLLLTALLLWRGATNARQQAAARLTAVAEAMGRETDNTLQMHLAAIQILAERRNDAGDLDDLAAWASDLQRVHHHYPAFTALLVTDRDGGLLLSQPAVANGAQRPSLAGREHFSVSRRSGHAYVSDAFRGRVLNNDPLVAISVPLFGKDGRFAGVVEGSIRLESLVLHDHRLRARGFEFLLLDRNHAVVQASAGLPYRPLEVLGDTQRDRSLRALPVSDRARMQTLPGILRDGGDAYALAAPLEVGWSLWLMLPKHLVERELRSNALVMLGLLIAVMLGVLAIVGTEARQLGSSVRGLLERMQRFALDRAPEPIPPESLPRELAPLAETMNQLAARVRIAYAEVSAGLDEQSHLREELQAVAQRLITVQEDERRTLSRELHDDIGQSITAIKLSATALLDDDPAHQEIIGEIVAIADQTVAKLRNLSLLLRPPQLDSLGLEAALRGQIAILARSTRTEITLQFAPLPQRPPMELELACFRIAQEALTNAMRYADARSIQVTLETDGQTLELQIRDDGRGFDPAQARGLGLLTMRERVQQLGGTLTIQTAPGRGTCVHASLPMPAVESA